jgi:hypothetical protein
VTDEITLTIPRERAFHRIAHLVLGGVAVRQNLTLEHLEDLQLAVDGLLEQRQAPDDVTVELHVRGRLRAELDRDPQDGSVGLSRLLATVVDDAELVERRGRDWIRLVKDVGGSAEVGD